MNQNEEIEFLKECLDHLHHRVVAFEQKERGNSYFDVEYNNTTDPDHWTLWGISSIYLEDLKRILDSKNKRIKNNDNMFFKTIRTFRIVKKHRGVHKVIQTFENDAYAIHFEEYLKTTQLNKTDENSPRNEHERINPKHDRRHQQDSAISYRR
jgi:hypothetical protein